MLGSKLIHVSKSGPMLLSQNFEPWIGKYNIHTAWRLEHLIIEGSCVRDFHFIKNNCSHSKMVLLSTHGSHFVCSPLQPKYLYHQSQYLKSCIGKGHILVAQRLEHLAFREVMGSSPIWNAIFHFRMFRSYQEQLFTIENGCCCPRTAGSSGLSLYKQKYQIHDNF